jgi:hypothetical protein
VSIASFRFYGQLNDFLPPRDRGKEQVRHFIGSAPVKDLIESFGVPHPEVYLVLIDGDPVPFSSPVLDGSRVSVFPPFHSIDISSLEKVRPAGPAARNFVLDVHLGRLARYLRMLGFDTLYSNNASDPQLAHLATQINAILLTRDRYLLMRAEVVHGYWVRSTNARHQLREVVTRFDLLNSIQPFIRCMTCNGQLQPVAKQQVIEQLPPKIRDKQQFRQCGNCGKLYWEGTHHQRMTELIEWLALTP